MNSRAMMWAVLVAVRVYDPETKGLLNSRNWVTEDDNCSFELQRFFFADERFYAVKGNGFCITRFILAIF